MRALLCIALGFVSATAAADTAKGTSITAPKAGDNLSLFGAADWPKQQWLYAAPSSADAAGKVVIHWFCTPKVSSCTDDLARIITLRDAGRVYIVAYINAANEAQAKKLDPIRESEGVGRGTVAYGKGVATLMKGLKIASGPASIVVDVDGKVKALTTSGDMNELDARDTMVNSLIAQIKEYTSSKDGPATAKPGEKFNLVYKVQLASWLTYSKKSAMSFVLTAPKDIKCDGGNTLKDDQLKINGQTLTATMSCSAPRGSYEVQGKIRFSYDAPGGGTGLGDDGATWKFDIK